MAEDLAERDTSTDLHEDSDGFETASEPDESIEPAVVKNLDRATELKLEGNELYKQHKFTEALAQYSAAIGLCPEEETGPLSVFFANRAAVYLSLEDYESSYRDCTDAIKLNADYIKALVRRARVSEKLDREIEALDDWKRVLELDPSMTEARGQIARLGPIVHEKTERQKKEVMDKLKGLGNSILGKFGLSLDNFKAQQDPATGSYSINFGNDAGAGNPGAAGAR